MFGYFQFGGGAAVHWNLPPLPEPPTYIPKKLGHREAASSSSTISKQRNIIKTPVAVFHIDWRGGCFVHLYYSAYGSIGLVVTLIDAPPLTPRKGNAVAAQWWLERLVAQRQPDLTRSVADRAKRRAKRIDGRRARCKKEEARVAAQSKSERLLFPSRAKEEAERLESKEEQMRAVEEFCQHAQQVHGCAAQQLPE